jgi:ATP-dependent helicase/DNAse subunit B
VSPNAADTFLQHLDVLRRWFGVPKRVKEDFLVPALIDPQRLAEQSSFFKLSMLNNAQWAVEHNFGLNPLSRLWKKLSSKALLASKLSEFVKIAEVAAVTVMGSVEDERTFSTLNYMKSKVWNNLDEHLDLVVRMFGQSFYDLKTSPCRMQFRSGRTSKLVMPQLPNGNSCCL